MPSRRVRRAMRLAAVLWVTASWIPTLLGVDPALGATAPPPVIRILEPAAGTPVAAYPVLIHGTVTPPDPDLRVTVNAWPTLMLPDGQWATLRELPPGTHELIVEGRARGAVVSRTVQRVTVAGPAPIRWPLLLRGGAQWAGLGMDRAVP